MNYYIPFSLKDGEHNIFDVITSIIGAEGIAPSGAAAFNGVETPRSSPAKFTGYHPLNPFANRVLAFSKLPVLSREGKYAAVRENTVYLCVNGESIEIPGTGHLELNEHQPLAEVELYFTCQAVLFKDPSSVTFIFMSENVFRKCEGCRSGVNAKNEKSFGYRLFNSGDVVNAVAIDDAQVDSISDESLYKPVSDKDPYVATWEKESLHGAVRGYSLVKMQSDGCQDCVDKVASDWRKFIQFVDWMSGLPCLKDNWSGRDSWRYEVERLRALPSFVKSVDKVRYFRNDDFGRLDPKHRALMQRFVKLAVSLKMKNWNWADNECRASFAESVMDDCIYPVMKEYYPGEDGEKKIETMSRFMTMVSRNFREYNNINFEFNEDDLKSQFVRAFYRFLQSEGRLDRMAEYLGPDSKLGLQTREMLAAMYGAFKGYAQVSVKMLAVAQEPLDNGNNVRGEADRSEPIGVNCHKPVTSKAKSSSVDPDNSKLKSTKKRIHKGMKNKQVPVDELAFYLSNGWELGYFKKQDSEKKVIAGTQEQLRLM